MKPTNPRQFLCCGAAERPRRWTLRIGMLAVLALTQLCANNAFAFLFEDNYVRLVEFPNLPVKNNGSDYTGAQLDSRKWRVKVQFGNAIRKISMWSVEAKLAVPGQRRHAAGYITKEYKFRGAPRSIDETAEEEVFDHVDDFAVRACKANAADLQARGVRKEDIYGRQHRLRMRVIVSYWYKKGFTGFDDIYYTPGYIGTRYIICRAWSSAQVPTGSPSLGAVINGIDHIDLKLTQRVDRGGTCKVRASGIVKTKLKDSTVEYHFEQEPSKRRSATYTVNTGATTEAGFAHMFDVPFNPQGKETGRIRVVVPRYDARSEWRRYELACTKPGANRLTALLPPLLDMEIKVAESKLIDGQICPTKINYVAGVKARSDLSGYILIFGDGFIGPQTPLQLANGRNKQYGATREIAWGSGVPSGPVFGSKVSGNNKTPLRSKTVWGAFNVLNENKDVVYQFNRDTFKLTCKYPQLNQALPSTPSSLMIGTNVSGAKLTAKAKATANGQVCQLDYKLHLTANVTNAKIPVEFLGNGRKLGSAVVQTNAQKEGWYHGAFGARDLAPYKGLAPQGKVSVSNKAEAYRGILQAVGTGAASFESNAVSYSLKCKPGAPSGLVMDKQVKPAVPGMKDMTADDRRQRADRARFSEVILATTPYKIAAEEKDKKESETKTRRADRLRRGTNDPAEPPAGNNPSTNSKQQIALRASKKRIDFAVPWIKLIDLENGFGKVTALIKNMGDAAGRTPYEITVTDDNGEELLGVSSKVRLRKNGETQVEKQFPIGEFASRSRSKRVTAKAEVKNTKDSNAGNNRKQTSATFVRPRRRNR